MAVYRVSRKYGEHYGTDFEISPEEVTITSWTQEGLRSVRFSITLSPSEARTLAGALVIQGPGLPESPEEWDATP